MTSSLLCGMCLLKQTLLLQSKFSLENRVRHDLLQSSLSYISSTSSHSSIEEETKQKSSEADVLSGLSSFSKNKKNDLVY